MRVSMYLEHNDYNKSCVMVNSHVVKCFDYFVFFIYEYFFWSKIFVNGVNYLNG